MKPFAHFNAKTIEDCISKLAGYKGKAVVIAGGTDLLDVLKNRILPEYPTAIINIKTIPNLDGIKEDTEGLRIGAITRLTDVAESPIVKGRYDVLAQAARAVASPNIRNMATIGGNLCQDNRCWYYRYPYQLGGRITCIAKGGSICYAAIGDNRYHSIFGANKSFNLGCIAINSSDIAVAIIALGAKIKTTKRSMMAESLFTGKPTKPTILDPDEIITEIQIPPLEPTSKQIFLKFRLRKSIDFSIVSIASVFNTHSGKVHNARIVLGAVAPIPLRARQAEDYLNGKEPDEEVAKRVANIALEGAKPLSNNEYKVAITRALVKKAILGVEFR